MTKATKMALSEAEYKEMAETVAETPINTLSVKKLYPSAVLPKRATEFSAGYDLYALTDGSVPANGQSLVDTGIAMAIPSGHVGLIWARSGLAVKESLRVGAGVVDEDYRGEVKVLLANHKSAPFHYRAGDRIAQILIQKIEYLSVNETDELPSSTRGEGGWGSTGS